MVKLLFYWCIVALFTTAGGFRGATNRNIYFALPSTAKTSLDQTQSSDMEREALRMHLLSAIDEYREVAVATPTNNTGDVPFTMEEKRIITMIEQIVKCNPTPICNVGWKGHGTNASARVAGGIENSLNGVWRLRFTTSVDGLWNYGRRGPQTITQMVNITQGTLTNVVEFKQHPGKIKGYRVIFEGIPVNDQSLQLKMQKLVIDRKSRFKKLSWFNTVPIPLGRYLVFPFLQKRIQRPDEDNRWLTERIQAMRTLVSSPSITTSLPGQPQLETLYLDDEMRIHVTEDGNYHIHTRSFTAPSEHVP